MNCRRCCRSESSRRRSNEILRLCISCKRMKKALFSLHNLQLYVQEMVPHLPSSLVYCSSKVRVVQYRLHFHTRVDRRCQQGVNRYIWGSHHVDIKLVQAPEGGLGDLPQGKDEADSRKGALPSGQRAHVAHAVVLPTGRFNLVQRVHIFVIIKVIRTHQLTCLSL